MLLLFVLFWNYFVQRLIQSFFKIKNKKAKVGFSSSRVSIWEENKETRSLYVCFFKAVCPGQPRTSVYKGRASRSFCVGSFLKPCTVSSGGYFWHASCQVGESGSVCWMNFREPKHMLLRKAGRYVPCMSQYKKKRERGKAWERETCLLLYWNKTDIL